MNFSNTGPSPLLWYESFPWGTIHQECAAATGYSSCLKIYFCVGFLHGPWLLSGACSSLGSPWAAVSLRASAHALVWCSPCAAGWIFAPLWSSISCRRTACIVMVFFIGCSGISPPVPAEPLPLPSSVTLASAGLVLSCFLISLSQLPNRFFTLS